MTFAWPQLLWLLLLPVALFAFELRRRKGIGADAGRPKIMRAEAGSDSLVLTRDARTATPARLRPWLTAGLLLAIIAVARPQWGRIEEPVFDQSREIILAIDLSRSMLAPDVRPSRLERSKLLIQSLLEKLQGERVGLIVFSGTAFLQSPLSADYEILREFLPSLDPQFLPEGGSNYGALLDTALDAFGSASAADRFLIILSDGEATDENWKSRIADLTKRDIRVLGLGVGTIAGTMIPDGQGGFIKDHRGAVVLSKLESGTLQELAGATNGVYRDASGWIDLAGLVNETVNAGRKGQFAETRSIRLVDRFQWPLALAVWCLLVSLFYEFPVRPRPRAITLAGARAAAPSAAPTAPPMPAPAQSGPAAVALILGALVSAVSLPAPVRAQVKIAPVTPPAPSTAPAEPRTPGPLGRIVSRLAEADTRSARDWAELARETISWGSRQRSAQQPVLEGPVRDALAAVEIGSKLDAKTADWPKLKEELEALLQRPEPQQDQQQKQDDGQSQDQKDKQDQQQKSEQKDAQKSAGKPDEPKKDEADKSQKNTSEQKADADQQDKAGQADEKKDQQVQESAFGDMKDQPPAPPPSETQKVGGAQEKKDGEEKHADPATAVQLEKLEQLRDKDSPARLFQMMQAERNKGGQKKATKDW